MLTTYGMDVHQLQSTLSDPTHPFTNSLNVYAASLTPSIPASELIGVQMNKQASVGNATALNEAGESRRINTLNPCIIGFLMYLVDRGIMSAPSNEILIEWESLSEPTFGEKVDNMKKLAETAKIFTEAGRDPTFIINAENKVMKTLDIEDVATKADLEEFGEDDDLTDEELPVKDDI